jgi:hypothetical protein
VSPEETGAPVPEQKLSDEEIERRMNELEENPPKKLEDWPKERELRQKTFGGREGDHGYEDGPESKLGPSSLHHHEDGSVTIDGEPVDDPSEFKSDPIPGGPTDESSGRPPGEPDD